MKKIIVGIIITFIGTPTVLGYDMYRDYTNYHTGDQVAYDSKIYECIQPAYDDLCNQGRLYAPVTGRYRTSAWREIGTLTNSYIYNSYYGKYVSTSRVTASSFIPTPTVRTYAPKPIVPGRPSISVIGRTNIGGNYSLNWTIPVDSILGDTIKLYENGTLISEKAIDPDSAAKGGTFTIQNQSTGTFKYNIVMCLNDVCASSGNMDITVYDRNYNRNPRDRTYSNGYYIPDNIRRTINSAMPIVGNPYIDSINISNNRGNVRRVMTILSRDSWNNLFPIANNIYSYENFLQSVAKYPMFCGEVGDSSPYDADTVCKKELATLFTFYAQESGFQSENYDNTKNYGNYPFWKQGLYYTQIPSTNATNGNMYYGRGAFLLNGENNYKYTSLAIYNDDTLLKDPAKMSQDGYASLTSAMWYYMTPKNEVPSMHDIVVGNWRPTSREVRDGMEQGFGATMLAFDSRLCDGSGIETPQAQNLIENYKEFASTLNLSYGTSLSCKNLPPFGSDSYPINNYFWAKDSDGECRLSSTENNYYVFKAGSYEACKADTNPYITPVYTQTTSISDETNTTPITPDVPAFGEIPTGTAFEDLSQKLEEALKRNIASGSTTKTTIQNSLKNFDTWLNYLSNKNETTGLTGGEKRSFFIISMIKDIYSLYQ